VGFTVANAENNNVVIIRLLPLVFGAITATNPYSWGWKIVLGEHICLSLRDR